MRKSFTLLFAALLSFAGVVKAGVTDLPQMSEGETIKWYTIKNTRSGKYASYAGDEKQMTQVATPSLSSLFYFTASDAETAEGFTPVEIHNAVTTNLLADFAKWTSEGNVWFISTDSRADKLEGLHITKAAKYEGWNAWNDGGAITYYVANDAGSVFVIEAVEDTEVPNFAAAYKTAAVTELENLATVSVLYPSATDAVAAVNAVEFVSNDYAEAAKAVETIVADYRNAAYQALSDKYFTINTPARGNGYMQMVTSKVVGTANADSRANFWQFVYNNGAVNVYNPYIGKYLCEPSNDNSVDVGVTGNATEAGAYQLVVNAGAEKAEAKVKFTSNGKSVHMSGGSVLVRWNDGGASEWQVTEITDFSNVINLHKASAIATLDSWANLSVVFDANLIAAAKTAINGIATTDWATFAAIDGELKKVTDNVATKMFSFKNTDTKNSNRINAYLTANSATGKGGGAKTFDYNAIWKLISADDAGFYLYNELNNMYLKNPSSGGLTDKVNEAAVYTIEVVNNETGAVELHSGNETLHLAGGLDLMNYDYNDEASRWILAVVDVTADITTLLGTLTADDYAEVPALGQYPKAAYDALVEAETTAKTVAEVEAAVAAFKASKNFPVFTISNGDVKDYAKGMSIYDDNSGTLHFKATNVYDKTMWWVLNQTTTTVGVTENVEIYNVGTGNGFWGASSIKITETDENEGAGIADDNIFLFYRNGGSYPVHFQNSGSEIVEYWSYEATSGSAAMFTYIGNTYDLNQLTDEYFAAVAELAAVAVPNFNFASGVNNYVEEGKPALDAAVAKRAEVLGEFSTAEEIAAAKTQLEEALANVELNMPELGHYYRIRCTAEGMKRLQSTIVEGGDRLELKSGDEGINDGSIFFYTEGGLMSYAEKKYIDAYRFVAEGADVPQVVFSAAANGAVGCYNINVGGRYIFGAGDKIDSGTSTDDRNGYNWWLEEVDASELPNGEITGVANVEVQESTVIYDLLGRRVEKMEKGLYIVNGKKVLVK